MTIPRIPLKPYAAFILTLISVIGSLALAFTKGVDITIMLPTILGLYLGAKAGVAANSHWAASKDNNSNTELVIKNTDNI